MRKLGILRFVLPMLAILLCFSTSLVTQAKEVQEVETDGSVQFTGIYEPIGTPEPTPPKGDDTPPINGGNKPGGSLPKTNMIQESYLYWFGIGLFFFVILFWKRRKQAESTTYKQLKNKQKEGIIL
ncbi:LPXTG cell wall anchor domain-containing protein [Enterococcus casseliflavus]|uniref:LPXTG cell wall anchor domain-containing protein n=1 Tax=Enterococcus casseliflavus TaxID=37734 RepID=UPI0039A4AF73